MSVGPSLGPARALRGSSRTSGSEPISCALVFGLDVLRLALSGLGLSIMERRGLALEGLNS